ncbi:MAG TPA: single-stranded DNA-binding protein [Balneolales bacterium]|nr:single-stranded DNA-binding protein [Balneolales bacterium]
MSDLNLCVFTGRLGQSPEIRYTPSGVAVANFTIAVGKKYKNKNGEQVDQTEWVKCVAWKRLAEIIGEYCDKGSRVQLSGEFQTRKWDDKDGNARYTTEIVVDKFQMLDSKGQSQDRGPEGTNPGDPVPGFPEDDIPF